MVNLSDVNIGNYYIKLNCIHLNLWKQPQNKNLDDENV